MSIRITDAESAERYLESVGGVPEHDLDCGDAWRIMMYCPRCGGTGEYPSTLHDGICFQCEGKPGLAAWSKLVDKVTYARKVKSQMAKRVREDRKAAEKVQAGVVAFEGWLKESPVVGEALKAVNKNENLARCYAYPKLISLIDGIRARGEVSDKQKEYGASLAQKILEAAKEDSLWVEVVPGRREMRFEIISAKWCESRFGGQLKMLISVWGPEGPEKLWGTLPRALWEHLWDADEGKPRRGARAFMKATVSVSERDPKFGFFSRPTGCEPR